MVTKVCCACGKRKDRKHFGKKANAKDGLQSRCNPCRRERAKELREHNWKNLKPDRFWPKVDKRGPKQCWPWLAAKRVCNTKYTPMTYGAYNGGSAHRAAWILANGRQPKRDHVICHECDNPLCCNPAHLFEGTRSDNQKDMQRKFRSGILGEKNPKAKITEAQVRQIRQEEGTHVALGRKYGLDPSTIYNIRARRKWRHVE